MAFPGYPDPIDVVALQVGVQEMIDNAVGQLSEVARVLTRGKSTNQSIASRTPGTAYTRVAFDASGTDTTGGRLTWDGPNNQVVNASGESILIAVTARVAFAPDTNGARWLAIETESGSASIAAATTLMSDSNHFLSLAVSWTGSVSPGDSVRALCAQNSGGSINAVHTITNSGPGAYFEVTDLGTLA